MIVIGLLDLLILARGSVVIVRAVVAVTRAFVHCVELFRVVSALVVVNVVKFKSVRRISFAAAAWIFDLVVTSDFNVDVLPLLNDDP